MAHINNEQKHVAFNPHKYSNSTNISFYTLQNKGNPSVLLKAISTLDVGWYKMLILYFCVTVYSMWISRDIRTYKSECEIGCGQLVRTTGT